MVKYVRVMVRKAARRDVVFSKTAKDDAIPIHPSAGNGHVRPAPAALELMLRRLHSSVWEKYLGAISRAL